MAVANGYGKVATSGSVFMYDVGDTRNSFKGQPTTNAVGNLNNFNPLDLYTTWASSGNACTLSKDTLQSPVGNTPLKMVVLGNDSYTNTYNNTGNNISAASSGQTWTISVWAKANQNTVGQIFHFGANSSGNYIDFDATGITITTEWTRYSYTRTFTDGNVVAIQTRLDGPDTFQSGDIIWWDGLQVEQKSYATQFTTGTRSATQGLLPLVGNSTINLSNVSFDSNAQIVFDGTDDTISSPSDVSNNIAGNITMELVLNRTDGYASAVMHKEVQYTLYIAADGAISYADSSYWSYGAFGFHYAAITPGLYHHIVATKNGSLVTIYVDGNVAISQNFGSAITQTNSNLYIGSYNGGSAYFAGKIPIAKLYNRAISLSEVRQNYNKYKTRFNLP
jgi:hypothetical protein